MDFQNVAAQMGMQAAALSPEALQVAALQLGASQAGAAAPGGLPPKEKKKKGSSQWLVNPLSGPTITNTR